MKMKKLYFIPAAMLGLAVAGCSSDDLAEGTGGPQWNSEGNGYVSLSLNLPTQAATGMRQDNPWKNDQFDDGEPSEYAVKDATLLIFKGTSESAATFQAAYSLPVAGSEFQNPENDQVTSTVQLTQKINSISATGNDKLYALVVLNKNNVFTVGSDFPTLTFGTTVYNSTSNLKLDNLMTMVITPGSPNTGVNASDAFTSNGILMMNAPLATAQGAATYSGTVNTLVEITNGIHTTEREAQENPAANIYVERAVAKVSVTATKTSGTLADGNKPETIKQNDQTDVAAWTINGWMLNNTNTASYFAHNYPTADNAWWQYNANNSGYRFIGTTEVGKKADGTTLAGYRIYWGADPNYDGAAGSNGKPALTAIKAAGWKANKLGLDNYDYCFENTFTTDFMNQDQTTQAVVAVQFNGGKDFWTLNGSTSTIYINQTDIDNFVKLAFYNTQDVKECIEQNLESGQTFNPATDLTVTYDKGTANSGTNPQAGKWTVTKVEIADGKATTLFGADGVPEELKENGSANQAGLANAKALQIECYDNGLAYYPVSIKHFGDVYTPWAAPTTGDLNTSYPNTDGKAANNWLGRYGVLRNNWYQIDVTNVTNIGYSDVPVVSDPDDPVARYISVKINILSWAVRKQSVVL